MTALHQYKRVGLPVGMNGIPFFEHEIVHFLMHVIFFLLGVTPHRPSKGFVYFALFHRTVRTLVNFVHDVGKAFVVQTTKMKKMILFRAL